DGSSRRRAAFVVGAGACLGLAVQTLQPTLLSATVVGLLGVLAVGSDRLRGVGPGLRRLVVRPSLLLGLAALLAFISAPVWYAVSGRWRPFWDGWWVYGRYMSSALGRSLPEQFGFGWDQFYAYTITHKSAHLCAVGFLLIFAASWKQLSRFQRLLCVALTLWWAAAWVELILTQRYSSHYFVVTSVPLMMMCCALVTFMVNALRLRGVDTGRHHGLAYLLLPLALIWSGVGPLHRGLNAAVSFRGVAAMVRVREEARDGRDRAVQAALDLISHQDDPILTWTNEPMPFLDFRRVSATRFIWKSFLMGEVYLGPTSTQYVLPGSWELWQSDVDATRPRAFLTDALVFVPPRTPAGKLLADEFELMLETNRLSLSVTPTVAAMLRDRSADGPLKPALPAGWTQVGASLHHDSTVAGSSSLALGDLRCRRFDATLAFGSAVAFRFEGAGSTDPELALEDGRGIVRPETTTIVGPAAPLGASRSLTLLVGRTVAVLMVDGHIVAGLNLLPSTTVSLVAGGDVTLSHVGTGQAPAGGQC
ncbi:MAG: hypothetical protein WCC60_17485, partial [Ilumatobacteraceae bacterium]